MSFGADQPERVCGGTRDYLDARAGQLSERFGSDPRTIRYYFVDSASEYCGDAHDPVGCVSGRDVFSEWALLEHELVHAARDTHLPRALEEGLATHWGEPWPALASDALVSRDRILEMLDSGKIETLAEYGRMAHFVAFLAERDGWEVLVDLDERLELDSPREKLDAALVEVAGRDLEGLLEEYADYPECNGYVSMDLSCGGPAIVLGQTETVIERTVDCGDDTTLGPSAGFVFTEEIVELAPTVDDYRTVLVEGDGIEAGGHVMMRACGPCGDAGVGLIETSGLISTEMLPVGRYVLRFRVPEASSPATIRLTIAE